MEHIIKLDDDVCDNLNNIIQSAARRYKKLTFFLNADARYSLLPGIRRFAEINNADIEIIRQDVQDIVVQESASKKKRPITAYC